MAAVARRDDGGVELVVVVEVTEEVRQAGLRLAGCWLTHSQQQTTPQRVDRWLAGWMTAKFLAVLCFFTSLKRLSETKETF